MPMTDDDAVARLEAFLQVQPDAKPWHPMTDYSLEGRRAIEGRHPQLIKDVFQPHRVMDAGCGPRGHLVTLLRELGVVAYGFDPLVNPDVPGTPDWIIRGAIQDAYVADGAVACDLVICREVLEHVPLRELLRTIAGLVRRSSRYLYVTTRFHQSPDHLLDVADHDDLDPTHITMLTRPFLRALFLLHGCRSRPDLEARMDWQQKNRVLVFEVAR